MNVIAVRSGRFFHTQTKNYVDQAVDTGVRQAQEALLAAIKGKVPVKTGALQRSLIGRGKNLDRAVRVELARGIPLDSGWTHASTKRQISAVRSIKGLRGKRKLLNFLKAKKTPGKRFFYATFDAVKAALVSQYLAPVGAAIVRTLEQ